MRGQARHARSFGALPFALFLALAFEARAEEWSFPGARYQAMGGAGVAVVDDGYATHWNPGALAFEQRSVGFELPFSLSTETLGDALADADDIINFVNDNNLASVLTKVQTGASLTSLELQDLLELAVGKLPNLGQEGEGFMTFPDLGFVFRKNRLAITVRGSGSLAIAIGFCAQ